MLVIAGLWVDGEWNTSVLIFIQEDQPWELSFESSLFGCTLDLLVDDDIDNTPPPGLTAWRVDYETKWPGEVLHRELLDFDFAWGWSTIGFQWYTIRAPHWFLTLIFATVPAIWLFKWNKRRKLAMLGCCPACRYDLTGNETGVCPECGVGTAKTAKSC